MLKICGGRCLHEVTGGIKVHQNYLYRWLTINSNRIQTLIHRYHPEKASLGYIMPLTLSARSDPGDCCLLGLGGAGVPHYLTPYLNNSRLLAIEHNADIIDVAKSHFMTNRLNNLSIIHQDANQFVQQCDQRFRHVLVDLSDSQAFPSNCNNQDFIVHCKKLLLDQGVLAMNVTHLHTNQELFKWVRQVFLQNTVLIPVKNSGNIILLACNSTTNKNFLEALQNNHLFKQLHWDPHWGCMAKL